LDFAHPILSGLFCFSTKAEIPFDSLQFKETPIFGFFRCSWCRVVTLRDTSDLGQVNMTFTMKVFPGVVVPQLVLGCIQDKPSLFPALDFEIGLEKQIRVKMVIRVTFKNKQIVLLV
jgi:hypothetical protein